MKSSMRFILFVFFLFVVLSGCATIKEVGKGLAGASTQVLEDKRKDALKESFTLDYASCYKKVKDILNQGVDGPYVYAEDSKKKMVAIYLSPADTTPVGIFFTQEAAAKTLVEVSSPSIYAKEEIAKKIFKGINALINPKIIEEKKTDAEEKVNN